MKKISLFCMLGLLLGVSCSKEKVKPPAMTDDTVAVFGDDAFGAFCLRTYDRNGDGVLTVGEIKNVVSLDFDDKDIRSLDGIEYFTGLQSLYCNQSAGGESGSTRCQPECGTQDFVLCGEQTRRTRCGWPPEPKPCRLCGQ